VLAHNYFSKTSLSVVEIADLLNHTISKNDGTFRLVDKCDLSFLSTTVAVIGPNAKQGQIQGGGSSGVKPHYQVHPLAWIIKRLGRGVEVLYEVSCSTHKYCPAMTAEQLRTAAGKDGYLIQSFSEQTWGRLFCSR
jgi:hypothetical protein